jgi:hypothetical protein
MDQSLATKGTANLRLARSLVTRQATLFPAAAWIDSNLLGLEWDRVTFTGTAVLVMKDFLFQDFFTGRKIYITTRQDEIKYIKATVAYISACA